MAQVKDGNSATPRTQAEGERKARVKGQRQDDCDDVTSSGVPFQIWGPTTGNARWLPPVDISKLAPADDQ